MANHNPRPVEIQKFNSLSFGYLRSQREPGRRKTGSGLCVGT